MRADHRGVEKGERERERERGEEGTGCRYGFSRSQEDPGRG